MILLDIRFPQLSGIRARRQTVDTVERAQVVMLTAFADLTDCETEVLAIIAGGPKNREIVRALSLGEGTTRNCVSNILSKLGVASRAAAAAYATEYQIA